MMAAMSSPQTSSYAHVTHLHEVPATSDVSGGVPAERRDDCDPSTEDTDSVHGTSGSKRKARTNGGSSHNANGWHSPEPSSEQSLANHSQKTCTDAGDADSDRLAFTHTVLGQRRDSLTTANGSPLDLSPESPVNSAKAGSPKASPGIRDANDNKEYVHNNNISSDDARRAAPEAVSPQRKESQSHPTSKLLDVLAPPSQKRDIDSITEGSESKESASKRLKECRESVSSTPSDKKVSEYNGQAGFASPNMVYSGGVYPGFMYPGMAIPMAYPAQLSFSQLSPQSVPNYAMLADYMAHYSKASPTTIKSVDTKDTSSQQPPNTTGDQQNPCNSTITHDDPSTPSSTKKTAPHPHSTASSPQVATLHGELNTANTYACMRCPRVFTTLATQLRHQLTHVHPRPFRAGFHLMQKDNCHSPRHPRSDASPGPVMETFAERMAREKGTKSATDSKLSPAVAAATPLLLSPTTFPTVIPIMPPLVSSPLEPTKVISPRVNQLQQNGSSYAEAKKDKPHTGGAFRCKTCGKSWDSSYMLERHKYLETCGGTAAGASENQFPLRARAEQPSTAGGGGGDQEFACPICKKRYKCEKLLKSHVKFTHLEERPHVCAVCAKAFKQKATLKQHEKLHADQKPYVCGVCARGFVYPSRLKTHQQTCKPGGPDVQLQHQAHME